MVVIPGALPVGVDADLARGWVIDALQTCLPVAVENGLTLSIENVGFQADVYARAEDLLSIDAFDVLKSQVSHVHVKDWKSVEEAAPPMPVELTGTDGVRYCPAVLGDGVVNLVGMIDRLRQNGYDGFVSVEYEGPDDPFDAMRKGVECVRGLDEGNGES